MNAQSLCWVLFPLVMAAGVRAAEPGSWRRTDTALARLSGTNVLWQVVADPAQGKPYFHPLATPGGVVLTDLRPADHPWHRGLWWSWKHINGLNYWEEDQKTGRSEGATELLKWSADPRPDGSARLTFELSYHPWNAAPVLTERRVVDVSAPSANGYALEWVSEFSAVTNVTLDRTPLPDEAGGKPWGGYAGFSLRLGPEQRKWAFSDSESRSGEKSMHGQPAHWAKLSAGTNGPAVQIFDQPDNVRYPTRWYISQGMPYFSPAPLFARSLALAGGEKLVLRYRLLVTDRDPGAPLRVLLFSGQNNHDWKNSTPELQQILAGSGRFTVEVTDHPEQCTAATFAKYDVVLSNWNTFGNPAVTNWPAETRAAFLDFVRSGHGFVAVHAGSSSFYDWPEYQQLSGASWKLGQTSHGAPHLFTVTPSAGHPVTGGMAPFTTTDELWVKPGVDPAAIVLATADGQPVALATSFGSGRGFTLLLGHDKGRMENAGFRSLLLRGLEWAATGKAAAE